MGGGGGGESWKNCGDFPDDLDGTKKLYVLKKILPKIWTDYRLCDLFVKIGITPNVDCLPVDYLVQRHGRAFGRKSILTGMAP